MNLKLTKDVLCYYGDNVCRNEHFLIHSSAKCSQCSFDCIQGSQSQWGYVWPHKPAAPAAMPKNRCHGSISIHSWIWKVCCVGVSNSIINELGAVGYVVLVFHILWGELSLIILFLAFCGYFVLQRMVSFLTAYQLWQFCRFTYPVQIVLYSLTRHTCIKAKNVSYMYGDFSVIRLSMDFDFLVFKVCEKDI